MMMTAATAECSSEHFYLPFSQGFCYGIEWNIAFCSCFSVRQRFARLFAYLDFCFFLVEQHWHYSFVY